MATKAYLSQKEFEEGKELFLSDSFSSFESRRLECSKWLSDRLEARLRGLPGWREAGVIRLGSWARGELAPKSDVDLILVGAEKKAAAFVKEAQSQGIKIRARLPESQTNWAVGVEPFDVLALFSAKAFDPETDALLATQKKKLFTKAHVQKIFEAIREERNARKQRYDSISNYLEPQLKFGEGGLRDLEQAIAIGELFPKSFVPADQDAFRKINEAKEFLLTIRQVVHWLGGSDILGASFQPEVARVLGYPHLSDLMKELQVRLERGSFYADWVVERAKRKVKTPMPKNLTPEKAVAILSKDPSLSNQYLFRLQTQKLWKARSDKERGEFLKTLFGKRRSDQFWVAFTRSLILEECVPEIKKIKGLTQHDHYHRYTVETHLYKTIRETDRVCAKPKELHALQIAAKALKAQDWSILRWTALFHDLGKGRDEDHSSVGAQLVRTKLGAMGLPAAFLEEVEWMVTNHLILTTAAFRQNANQSSTWKRLFDRGVEGERLNRLMVFSAIDIRATNPEAWTEWKAKLLADLYQKLRSPSGVSHQKFFVELAAKKTKIPPALLYEMDPFLVESIPQKILADDLVSLVGAGSKADLSLVVRKHSKTQSWVRFHKKSDRPGLFLEFVQSLFWLGARVDAAAVQTFEEFGVYDWFLVRTNRAPNELLSRLSQSASALNASSVAIPKVRFQSVDVVSDDHKQWILSFRGKDQKGLLLAAAQSLFDLGLAVRWARVHTWGSQIDDVFCVEAKGDLLNHLERLRERFVT